MRIINIYKELKNYVFLRKMIRKNKKSAPWNKLNLRTGWFGTIGTVINLPPEVFSGEEVYYQMYIVEQMKPINEYLSTLNLQEIIYPRVSSMVDKDKGEYAYLIKYYPLFRELSFGWFISRIAAVLLGWWIEHKFSLFSWLINKGSLLLDYLK